MNRRPKPMFLFFFTSSALVLAAGSAFACGAMGSTHHDCPSGVRGVAVQPVSHTTVIRPRARGVRTEMLVVNRGPNHEHIHRHTVGHPAVGSPGVVVTTRPGWQRNNLRGHAWLVRKQRRKIRRMQAHIAQLQADIARRDRIIAQREREIAARDREIRQLDRRVDDFKRRHHRRMKRRVAWMGYHDAPNGRVPMR